MPRLKIIFGIFSLGVALIILRLVNLQIFEHSKYQVMASRQHFSVLGDLAPRGRIYSSDGYLLVSNKINYLLYAEPRKISDPTSLAEKLMPLVYSELYAPKPYLRDIRSIKNNELELKAALSRTDLYYVAIKHGVTPESKIAIEALGAVGLGFEEESSRFYPEGDLATEVLGMVGQNKEGLPRGYFGLEGYYNGDLQGRDGKIYQEKNAFGQPILVGDFQEVQSLPGKDLILTINRSVQYSLEQKLLWGLTKYGAESATGVIMDPATGEILAMSSKYAGENSEASVSGVPRNSAIAAGYEPGSIIKPLTVAAALDSRVLKPDAVYNDTGPVYYSGHKVDNWDGKHHGLITPTNVLELSNNLGAAWIGTTLGSSSLRDYFIRFGLGSPLGIDLEGETGGIVHADASWTDIDTATASFGQGILTTPLQMASVFSTIANGGVLVRPHVVKGQSTVIRRVISADTSGTVTQMLTSAVDKGESRYYNLKKYTIAGKTGTAQIAINGSYDPQKTNTTFVGFLPKDPRFVMLIKLERPSSSIYAAETAVPLWMSLAEELAVQMRILPDR